MKRLRMLFLTKALVAAMVLPMTAFSSAVAGDDRWGWGYCAPPYPPTCVGALPDIKQRPGPACEQAVSRYVASVFRYRTCLAHEMERAVREANQVIKAAKCPTDRRYCYDLQPEGDSAGRK